MDESVKEQLDTIFEMYKNNADPKTFFTNAIRLKESLSEESANIERIADVLDSLVKLYAPKSGWDIGDLEEKQAELPLPQMLATKGAESISDSGTGIAFTNPPTKEFIRSIIPRFVTARGTVITNTVVKHLKDLGDTRIERDISKQVSNVLHHDNWGKRGKGIYKQPQVKEKEVTKASAS